MGLVLGLGLGLRFGGKGFAGPPANTVAPSISGIQTAGQTLAVSNGAWSQPVTSYAFQWKRNGIDIAGATAQTYVLQLADAGQAITCAVTATNGAGSGSAASASVTPVAALTLSGAPAAAATVGDSYSFTPSTAGGHAPKTWSITNKPAWATFSASTGQLTGTPSAAGTDAGIIISVTDADGLTASLAAFDITTTEAAPAPIVVLASNSVMDVEVWHNVYTDTATVGATEGGLAAFINSSGKPGDGRSGGALHQCHYRRRQRGDRQSTAQRLHRRGRLAGHSSERASARLKPERGDP
jgi:hypothetical protein